MSKVREKDILDEELGDLFKVLKHNVVPENIGNRELKTKEAVIPFKGREILIHEVSFYS